MQVQAKDTIVPLVVALIGVGMVVDWIARDSSSDIILRVPGLDRVADGEGVAASELSVPVAGEPIAGTGVASASTGTWPGFRGPLRDGISRDTPPLARRWPDAGPPQRWAVSLGEGYASAAIGGGCAYVLDYDEEAQRDTLRCLSLEDGVEIWRNSYPVMLTRNHGLSRTVPALVDDCVITMGPRCHVACWDAATGACRWLMDLVVSHGATVPRWYSGQCPLVDGDHLILAPCGTSLLIAVDYRTGELVWESPNPRGWRMTHASIMPMVVEGHPTYVYCGSGGVVGISAVDGTLLWDSTEWPEQFATSPSPLVLPGDRVFLSSGYGNKTGGLLLQVKSTDGQFAVDVTRKLSPKQFNSEQQTPILFEDHIYGIRKRGGGQLVCLDLKINEVWNSGTDRFGHGPYLIADGLILCLDNRGKLTLAEASPTGYQRLAQHEVFADGHDAWGPMAIVDGRLILRDMTRMVCLDLAEQ